MLTLPVMLVSPNFACAMSSAILPIDSALPEPLTSASLNLASSASRPASLMLPVIASPDALSLLTASFGASTLTSKLSSPLFPAADKVTPSSAI